MKNIIQLAILFISFSAAAQTSLWNATLVSDSTTHIPFLIEIDSAKNTLSVINGDEVIIVENLFQSKDSLAFDFPVFGSRISATLSENKLAKRIGKTVINMEGFYYKYANKDSYAMPFKAYKTSWEDWRRTSSRPASQMDGKWAVTFTNPDESTYEAIGEFEQNGNELKGTFLTNTGDYRFLAGKVNDNKFFLSCVDGAHVFFFSGQIFGETILGDFYSGKTWHETFEAKKDENATLKNPYKLTFLKEGYSEFDFSFPSFKTGENIALNDELFEDKAMVIQIMGTWCPNCMDETALYARLAADYKEKGVEFVAVSFERGETLEDNKAAVEKFKNHFNIDYPILFGGKASKKLASERFPMLNEIISFPTTIVLNKNHEVVNIHTGFYGPATSEYDKFVDDFVLLLNKIAE